MNTRIQFSPATKGTYSKEVEIPADEFGLPYTNPPAVADQNNIEFNDVQVGLRIWYSV